MCTPSCKSLRCQPLSGLTKPPGGDAPRARRRGFAREAESADPAAASVKHEALGQTTQAAHHRRSLPTLCERRVAILQALLPAPLLARTAPEAMGEVELIGHAAGMVVAGRAHHPSNLRSPADLEEAGLARRSRRVNVASETTGQDHVAARGSEPRFGDAGV